MKDEVRQILRMVENGKITAEQAAQLIETGKLDKDEDTESGSTSCKAKWLKVRVYEAGTGKSKVKVNVPLSLVSVGLKLGMHFGLDKEELKGLDLNDIIRMIEAGEEGRLVDVVDEERGKGLRFC